MDDLVAVIFGDGVVDPPTAIEVFAVLAPLVDCVPDDEEAVDAAAQVIARMPDNDVVAAVLDWWLIVTTGHRSANNHAYALPEVIDGDLRNAMEALRDLNADVPAAAWASARRRLAERLAELDSRLDIEQYGAVKLQGERVAWSTLLDWVKPWVDGIKQRDVMEPYDFDEALFCKEMKQSGIDENSRRWKEMLKRARSLSAFLREVAELVSVVRPRRTAGSFTALDELPASVREPLGPIAELVLRAVLQEPPPRTDDEFVATRTHLAAERTDDLGRWRLADIVDAWFDQTGLARGPLQEPIRVLERLRGRAEALDREGVDVDEVRLHLLEYDVPAAEAALDQLEAARRSQDRARKLAQRVDALQGRLEEEGLGHDPFWSGRVHELLALVEAGDTASAERRLQEVVGELDRVVRQRRLKRLRERLAELEALDAPTSVLFDLSREVDDFGADEALPISDARVAEADALVEQFREAQRDQAAELVGYLEVVEREALPVDLRLEIESAVLEMREALEHGDDVAWVAQQAGELLESVERRRIIRWSIDDGEDRLVRHLVDYCQDRMDFGELDVRRLYTAMKTKPFVIIAGLTGSGKSSIARLIAEAMGATAANGQFRRVAVRPDWIDQSEVLGYVNPTSQRFEPGWLADVMRACERQPDRIFFALLDEMNLAPVEQYLAEVLSAMEEARAGAGDVRVPLYARGAAPANAAEWPAELRFPSNLMLIGTVNVDETTRPLSERVLDRANVLQLSLHWTQRHHDDRPAEVQPWHVGAQEWRQLCRVDASDLHHDFLVDVAECLQRVGIGVGLRAHIELERFIANSEGVLDEEMALDVAVLQRIIPKVRGFKRDVAPALEEVREELQGAGCVTCVAVLDRWLDATVSDDEFLDGTDARIGLIRVG